MTAFLILAVSCCFKLLPEVGLHTLVLRYEKWRVLINENLIDEEKEKSSDFDSRAREARHGRFTRESLTSALISKSSQPQSKWETNKPSIPLPLNFPITPPYDLRHKIPFRMATETPLNYRASDEPRNLQVTSTLPSEVAQCLQNARFVCFSLLYSYVFSASPS